MKKVLLIIVLLCSSLFLLTGCGNKDAITAEAFEKAMKKNEYKVLDYTEDYQSSSGVELILEAGDINNNFGIKYFKFKTEEDAKSFFNQNKKFLENSYSTKKIEFNTEMFNYQKYTLTVDDHFFALSRIDNTIVSVDAPKNYKEETKEVLEDLGY